MTNNERRENEKGRVGVRGNATIDQEVEDCWCVVVLVGSKTPIAKGQL